MWLSPGAGATFVQRKLPLTLNVCGSALERTPWVAQDSVTQGFEICAHGWRRSSPALMDEETERVAIARTAVIIRRLWVSPQQREHTWVGRNWRERLKVLPGGGADKPLLSAPIRF